MILTEPAAPVDARDSFSGLRARHAQRARALVSPLAGRLDWSAEQLASERRDRLCDLLRTARDHAPWHARRLADIDVDSFEERDLRVLPVMTKSDVMANFDRIVTERRLSLAEVESHLAGLSHGPAYLPGGYRACASGGSSGLRGTFLYGWDAWATVWNATLRYLRRSMGTAPFSIAVLAAGNLTHMSFAMVHSFTDPAEIVAFPVPVSLTEREIVARLNELQPDVLGGYASMLDIVAAAARRGDLRIRPRAVTSFSEPLLPATRAACAEAFGAEVQNWWVATEAGAIGIGCGESDGMHLSDDLLIVEPVDANGEPVALGTLADKIYVTNLFNPVLPLIRYEINDRVMLLNRTCPCGSHHRLVADVQGRLDDTFRYPGGVRIHPYVLWSALGNVRAISEYCVRQTPNGVTVDVRSTESFDALSLSSTIAAQLRALGVAEPVVEMRSVEAFDRQPGSGKLRRFVPLPA